MRPHLWSIQIGTNDMDSQTMELQTRAIKILDKARARPLVWDTITTTGWSTLGKAGGFLIPFFIAAWFGISSETDAFFFAYGVILFLSIIFSPVVESLIVPYIAEMRSKKEDIGKFLGRVMAISGVWLSLATGAFILFFKPILIIVTRFDEQSLTLVHQLMIEASPLFLLLIWTSLLTGALNAYKYFAVPAVAPAFRAAVALVFIFAFKDSMGAHSIAWAYVMGEFARMLILFWTIKRLKLFALSFSYHLDPAIREFLWTTSYQALSMVAVGLNPIIDKAMASWLGEGSVSIIEYASRLYFIPVTFMSSGLLVTLLSHWSLDYYELGTKDLKKEVNKVAKLLAIVTPLLVLFFIYFHEPIVRLAFQRGAFGESEVSTVGWVWICYLLGFVPEMIGLVYVRAYIILKKTRILMQIALFNLVIHVLWNLILIKYMGIAGIALSSSVTISLTAILLWIVLLRHWKRIERNAVHSF